ncbi:MAG: hypothetical protein DRH89_00895, partial [Candidatus Cloacimonadota bacterium]
TYGLDSLRVTADRGYSAGEELEKCKRMNVETYTPFQTLRNGQRSGIFTSDHFSYDSAEDCYICPIGRKLPRLSRDRYHKQTFYGSAETVRIQS